MTNLMKVETEIIKNDKLTEIADDSVVVGADIVVVVVAEIVVDGESVGSESVGKGFVSVVVVNGRVGGGRVGARVMKSLFSQVSIGGKLILVHKIMLLAIDFLSSYSALVRKFAVRSASSDVSNAF